MSRSTVIRLVLCIVLVSINLLPACAKIRLNAMQSPPPTAKLRVYVQPHTTVFDGPGTWTVPDEQYIRNQFKLASEYLSKTGIYEVVSRKDEQEVLGGQHPLYYDMVSNDCALAKDVGKALYADYVMVMERGTNSVTRRVYFRSIIINVESGIKYGVEYEFPKSSRGNLGKLKDIMQASYIDLFKSTKADILATAMKKSAHLMPTQHQAPPQEEHLAPVVKQSPGAEHPTSDTSVPTPSQKPIAGTIPEAVAKPAQTAEPPVQPEAAETSVEDAWIKKYDVEEVLARQADPTGGKGARLIVYDLDTMEHLKTISLILSEALREELFLLKRFILVDREDLEKILQEMALQQTGLVDEKQVARTGKVLAAGQVVTGRLGHVGKTYILQAKRVDVETMESLGLASARFADGQEDEILSKMPDLAKRLAGL